MIINSDFPTIRSFNELSEMGDEIFAPSIFLGNCNLRCPYCMNSKLVLNNIDFNVDITTIKEYVEHNSVEWMIISGGEPTCTELDKLTTLLKEIKSWRCKIGMSTNGTNPDVLNNVLDYLSYVSLDIKCSSNKDYLDIGSKNGIIDVLKSKSILSNKSIEDNNFKFEIRTTLYPKFITPFTIVEIGSYIDKKDRWKLQIFRKTKHMLSDDAYNAIPYNDDDIEEIKKIASIFSDNVSLKYV